jgi:ATP phosphoribosyltransferase regulatory subunit
MTPQVSRIDAHLLNREGVARLCYCGPVLHARPAGLLSSRELLQIGAEIFGYSGIEADIEIIRLALESIRLAGVQDVRLDVCHAGLIRALIESDPAALVKADEISVLLRDKDLPGLRALSRGEGALNPATTEALSQLPLLYGDASQIARAHELLPKIAGVTAALNSLEALLAELDDVSVGVDLSDVGAYGYHSGIIFSVYAQGWHDALAQGGRYDGVSLAFGRARPATGFSLDLRKLTRGLAAAAATSAVRAPAGFDAQLRQAMKDLRQAGEIVVQVFAGEHVEHDEFVFDRELVKRGNKWVVEKV